MNTTSRYNIDQVQAFEWGWLSLVTRSIFVRATIAAVVIGCILTVVNQSGWVFGIDPLNLLQLILVFGLPFSVVTVSQIAGLRRAYTESVRQIAPAIPESIVVTAASHGIPTRAVAIGLAFGSLNASIVLVDVLLRSADIATMSTVSLAQAYVLPMLFSVLSQAFSYRRYRYPVVNS